ncbi:META domain-containing protein [Flavobacterium aquatile]|uniref:META domain-containing protein n=1 Tax=Flavobacterium aquatile TaxID=245 RepID=UPI000AD03ABE|nr:META domain-containing protein [Flavobacterium aquatile]
MKKLSILILVSIFTFSCNCKKKITETPTQNINRVWMLVEFKDYKKEFFVEKKAFLDMTNSERASSKMGCNNLSFSYSINDSKSIQFSQGIATRMYCDDAMKLENDFLNEIPSIKNYKVEGHFLTLTSSNGEKMVFVAQDWD